jgi:hypothetical protein
MAAIARLSRRSDKADTRIQKKPLLTSTSLGFVPTKQRVLKVSRLEDVNGGRKVCSGISLFPIMTVGVKSLFHFHQSFE